MSEPTQTEDKVRYMAVPPVRLTANIPLGRLNIAGWADTSRESYTCQVCKKQVHLALTELQIFPEVEADKDLFHFAFAVAPHKVGGAFSTEICKGSQVRVARNELYPTVVKTMKRRDVPTAEQEGLTEETEPQEESPRRQAPQIGAAPNPELKKKLDGLSPKEAEDRYNYLLARSITDLTDEEYEERLALAERLSKR